MSMKLGHENGLYCRGHGLLPSGLQLPSKCCSCNTVDIFPVDIHVSPYICRYM